MPLGKEVEMISFEMMASARSRPLSTGGDGTPCRRACHEQAQQRQDVIPSSICGDDQTKLNEAIENVGSDHLPTFGGKFEGGYHIQQNPAEFADLVRALKGRAIQSYLQIGSAAGGTERFLCEYVGIRELAIIDDGQHPNFHIWTDVNRRALEAQGVKVSQHIGDSHDQEAGEFLARYGKTFDLIGIDGDHTPTGVRMDWKLIEPYLKAGMLVWFHDLSSKFLPPGQRGGKEVWDIVSKRHKVILETYRHCGIGMLEIT